MCIESRTKVKWGLSALMFIFSAGLILGGVAHHSLWWLLLMTLPLNILSYVAIARRDKIQLSISKAGVFYSPLGVIAWHDITQVVVDGQYIQLNVSNLDEYCDELPFFQKMMWKLESSAGWGLAINTEILEHNISQYLDCIRRLHPDIPIQSLNEI